MLMDTVKIIRKQVPGAMQLYEGCSKSSWTGTVQFLSLNQFC